MGRAVHGCLLALCLGLSGALCQPTPPPLVLSGDEILHSGPLHLDETDLQALVTGDWIRVRGEITSDLPLSLGGRVHLSLRDLDEHPAAEGTTELQPSARGANFEVWMRPGLDSVRPGTLARYVVHGTIQGLGQTLRFRRSLYQASRQITAEVVLPAMPLPGHAFPVLASAPDQAQPLLLGIHALRGDDQAQTLGFVRFDEQGIASGTLRAPGDEPAPLRLNADLVAEDLRMAMPTSSVASSRPLIDLFVGGHSAAPGDEVEVVAWVRERDGRPRTAAPGMLCLSIAPQQESLCWPVRTDARGLVQDRIEVAPALAGLDVVLDLEIAGAAAQGTLAVSALPSLELPLPTLQTPGRTASGDLRVPVLLASTLPGHRLHAELHLEQASGPLIAELDLPLDGNLDELVLPVPAAAVHAASRWSLLLGAEDPLGRRTASARSLMAAPGDLAVALHTAELWAGQPFCALVTTATLDGQPVPSSGVLDLGEHHRSFSAGADGTALLCGLEVPAGDSLARVQVVDVEGRSGEWQGTLQISPADAAGMTLHLPLVVPDDANLPIALSARGDARLLESWFLASGRVVDLAREPSANLRVATSDAEQVLTLASFASAGDGLLLRRERRLLPADDGRRLQLDLDAQGRVLPRLRQRDPAASAPAWVTRAGSPDLNAGLWIDETRARALALEHPESSAQDCLAASLLPVSSLSGNLSPSAPGPEDLAVALAKVVTDLEAIARDLGQQLSLGELVAADLNDWVGRRARVYYDPWGQPYALWLADGQLWLESTGFDELAGTPDDRRSGRYLHSLLETAPVVETPAAVEAPWARAIRPWPTHVVSDNEPITPWHDGQPLEIVALTSGGRAYTTRASAAPALELLAPVSLRLRRGDRLQLETLVRCAGPCTAGVEAWVEDPTHLLLEEDPALLGSTTGWQRWRISLRALTDRSTTLHVVARDDDARRDRAIGIVSRDQDQERGVLASQTLWIEDDTSWLLTPASSPGRRQRVLFARAFEDGLALALALHEQLPEPESLDDAATILSLPLAATTSRQHVQWALATMLAHQRSDGGFSSDRELRSSVRATLVAIEALCQLEASWNLPQPALEAALRFIDSEVDARGALTPELLAADAQVRDRERLRSTARLVRALARSRAADALVERGARYLLSQLGPVHDARTTALMLRALQAVGTDTNTRDILLEQLREATQSDPETSLPVFAGEIDDGAQAQILANAQGLLALRELGVWDDLARQALQVTLRAVAADGLRVPVAQQAELLQALASLPRAHGSVPSARLIVGTSDVTVSPTQPASLAVELGPVDGQLVTGAGPVLVQLWLEGEPSLPFTAGPAVDVDIPALLTLQVGELHRIPITWSVDDPLVRIEVQSSPCLAAAVRTSRRHIVPRSDGIASAVLAVGERTAAMLELLALCPGHLALPVLHVAPASEPWRITTTRPGLVVIE
ncbi:MAG: prenyltransferase/squalene oxidase repeat-containing protein [Pseudomonadota bacterium]